MKIRTGTAGDARRIAALHTESRRTAYAALMPGHYLDGQWILGQGTIYPDTIESGGTANADVIKTHHNRVAGIQRLIEQNRIVEPLASFYKDEVRDLGRVLVRFSGTEPLARVMVEGHDITLVDEFAERIAEAIRQELGA